jgi:hypothetical protein
MAIASTATYGSSTSIMGIEISDFPIVILVCISHHPFVHRRILSVVSLVVNVFTFPFAGPALIWFRRLALSSGSLTLSAGLRIAILALGIGIAIVVELVVVDGKLKKIPNLTYESKWTLPEQQVPAAFGVVLQLSDEKFDSMPKSIRQYAETFEARGWLRGMHRTQEAEGQEASFFQHLYQRQIRSHRLEFPVLQRTLGKCHRRKCSQLFFETR